MLILTLPRKLDHLDSSLSIFKGSHLNHFKLTAGAIISVFGGERGATVRV